MGVAVEVAAADFRVTDPATDGPLPGGAGHLVADHARAILRIAGVGTFAIAEGTRVWFDPEPRAQEGAASLWLHGTVAALLLAQRGWFALHASVVEVGGVAVAVAGRQRAGKSTTALRLTQLGHPLVTDDVSPLVTDGAVTVHPFARPIHVSAETATSLGLDVSAGRPLLPEHPKLALPAASRDPVPLGAIAILQADADETVDTVRVRGARASWLVGLNLYRARLLRRLWQTEMFAWTTEIAERVPIHVVTRPSGEWTVDAVAHAVERIAADARP